MIHLHFIANIILLKHAAWKAILISMAGRVQLVKSDILGMTVHCIMIYKWPASMIKNIEKWMGYFIWSGYADKKKISQSNGTFVVKI